MNSESRLSDAQQMLTIDDIARKLNVPASEVKILIDADQLLHFRLVQQGEIIRVIRRDLMAFKASRLSGNMCSATEDSQAAAPEICHECP